MGTQEIAAPRHGLDDEALRLEIRRLAHDLNNTLMPILLGVESLRRKSSDPSLERTISNMERAVQRAAELTASILDAARIAAGDPGEGRS